MNRKIFLFLVLIFLTTINGFGKSLTILWWNAKNFFDTVDDKTKDDSILTEEKYRVKLGLLSKQLKKINCQMAGFAEVENIKVIKDIAEQSGYTYYYLLEGNDPRGIDVGLISKIKVEYKTHKDTPTPYKEDLKYKFSRDCPEAVFSLSGKRFHLLLNHLKSNLGGNDLAEKKRIAQVKGILDIIAGIYKEEKEPNLIVMGDLNSNRYTQPLNILEKAGLSILNYNYSESSLYTFIYKKNKIGLDYFIINKELNKLAKKKKLKTINDKEIKKISDHLPLVFELSF